jgi:acyl-coenzyme A thioesterase 13
MDFDDLKRFLENPRHDGWRVPGLEAVHAEQGHVVVRLEVTDNLLNFGKTLHGGAAATLVDVVGSIAIITADRHGRFGVSTDLNVTWLAPAPLGEWVQIEARVLKSGRTMSYVAVEIRRESDDVLCVQGRMTKHLGDVPPADLS